MATVRCQVRHPFVGGGAGDVSINTLYFRSPQTTDADLAPITSAIATFFTSVKPLYSSDVNFASSNVTYYDMSHPKPRAPIFEGPLGTTGTGAAAGGPAEIAICLSFYGLKVAGIPFSRKRGRIYLGPIAASKMVANNVAANDVTTVTTAGAALLVTANAAAWDWVIWSQTQADAPIGTNFPDTTVIGGWVDNAWDVQRRRGAEPSSRNTYGLTPSGA